MPYNTNEDLPDEVRKLPDEAQAIWREAYNQAYEKFGEESPGEREGRSAASAWAAVRKAGFEKEAAKGHQVNQPLHHLPKSEKKFKPVQTDEGVLFKGAVLFAEGDWTDSASMMEVHYSKSEIAKSVGGWIGQDVWGNMHTPDRRMTDHLGKVATAYMQGGKLLGDLLLHGKTQASRDAIQMWGAGLMPDLSVEMATVDKEQKGALHATQIQPVGVAWVDMGACDLAKVAMRAFKSSSQSRGDKSMADNAEKLKDEIEQMKAKLAKKEEELDFLRKKANKADDLVDSVKEASKAIGALTEEVAGMKKASAEKDEVITDLQAQVKAMGKIEVKLSEQPSRNGDGATELPVKRFKRTPGGLVHIKGGY
jgi:cation transport regulator ChaB